MNEKDIEMQTEYTEDDLEAVTDEAADAGIPEAEAPEELEIEIELDPEQAELEEAFERAREKVRERRERQRRWRPHPIVVAVIAIVVLMMAASIRNLIALQIEHARLVKEHEELIRKRDKLQIELKHVNSKEYIEEQARRQLRLVNPDEILFIFPNAEDQ